MRLFVDNITVIDCSYLDIKRGLVGESWMVDVELVGSLDDQNMVMDFGKAKKVIKNAIDDTIDHTLAIPALSASVKIDEYNDRATVTFEDVRGHHIIHDSPIEAITLIDATKIDAETVKTFLENMLRDAVGGNTQDVIVTLRTEPTEGHYYHYSHGLKKHGGNCQRIAHGHRSRIFMNGNGARATKWEHHWADLFEDIYIGSQEDIVGKTNHHGVTYLQFEYTSSQGLYKLEIAEERCYIMDHDTTVELIAHHIAHATLEQSNQEKFYVRAFEGVGKGAVAET